jgi:feruloyl esterase
LFSSSRPCSSIFQSANFDFHTLNFTSDIDLADDEMGAILNSTDPDLRPFKAHGGKIIHYVGWADSAIAPINSVNYYNDVAPLLSPLYSSGCAGA